MIPNITTITTESDVKDIRDNFEAIQTAISSKQLSFHYLDLYTLKGSVVAETNAITREYNLLNLNEALLIVVNSNDSISPAEEKWRNNMTLYAGDYLVKTMAGPLRIPGPTTGYYIPAVDENTGELTYTYRPTAPTEEEQDLDPVNIQGAPGSGYDLTYSLLVNTDGPFPAKYNSENTIIRPIIQIYDPVDNMLIDYPYTLNFSDSVTPHTYTLKIKTTNEGTGKTFTVRVR